MKRLFITLLQETERKIEDTECKELINRLLGYKGDIENLSLDDLLSDNNRDDGQNSDKPVKNRTAAETEIKDFRIKSLSFYNFRTYPTQHGRPYGLSFNRSEQNGKTVPCSVFLVGKNGTGKSTVFDSLELIYAGKVSNAKTRGIKNRDELFKYLTYGFGTIPSITQNEVRLGIKLADDENERQLTLEDMAAYCVPALCCSDWDIEELSKIENDVEATSYMSKMQMFVAEQLGYGDYLVLRNRLNAIKQEISNIREKTDKKKTLKNLNATTLKLVETEFRKIIDYGQPIANTFIFHVAHYAQKVVNDLSLNTDLSQINRAVFRNLWDNLLQNLQILQQADSSRKGFLNDGIAELKADGKAANSDESIKTKSNAIIENLRSCYGRLKQACDEYKNDEKFGLEKALNSLSDDISFLDNEADYVKSLAENGDEELSIAICDKLSSQIEALVNYMNFFIRYIFKPAPVDENEKTDGTKDANDTVYPPELNKFVKETLQQYAEPGETLDIECTSNSFKISITAVDNSGNEYKTTPREYYNTFRFKLYTISLKIALAFYYMKTHKCYAPIVIDDVFNAGDFENSVNLYTFVHKIYDVYQKIVDTDRRKPLQLIILTHDEMILNAFQTGSNIYYYTDGHINNYISGRLFPWRAAEEISKSVTASNSHFLNLYLSYNKTNSNDNN